jgi:hypothetical protein
MTVLATKLTPVADLKVGQLLLVTDQAGRIFAAIKGFQDGMGVRTIHLFGYASRTLGLTQSAEIGS